jgi:hypothetical protein
MRPLFAAIRADVERGLDIVKQIHKQLNIEPRLGAPGPLMQSWQSRATPPEQEPKADVGEYWLNGWDHHNIDGVRTMMRLAKASKRPGLKAAAYRDAGQHLARLRFRSGNRDAPKRERFEWLEIVKRECGLSRQRADELVAIWEGTKPLATLHAEKKASVKKCRKNKGKAV